MSAATHHKVAVRDVAPNRRRGGDLRVLLSPSSVGATSGFMGVGVLVPGERITEHYHPYSEEFIYVTRGRIQITLDGVAQEVTEAGEGFMIPIGLRHSVLNVGDADAEVVFHNSPLAPSPELGHVDTEAPLTDGPNPAVGGPRTPAPAPRG